MSYWQECVKEAFDDSGITATEAQIQNVVEWIESAHENYGTAHGHDCIPNPLARENALLRIKLQLEKDKINCPVCDGKCVLVSDGPCHSSVSQCWRCRGEGRVSP